MRTLRFVDLLLTATVALWAHSALATYSIVAGDSSTKQVGGAATSCIAGASVSRVYQGVPGVGAVHAQAFSNIEGRRAAARLLAQGRGVEATLAAITRPSFDPSAALRQYGMIRLDGTAVGFTGSDNGFFAADRQGVVDGFVYSVQGNILTSARVLTQSEAAFRQPACDLAGRLIAALEAGALNGEGDSRCRPARPSDAAFIQVDNPDGSLFVRLDVRGSRNPIGELKAQFATFRSQAGCYR